jgi:hypothetical protein
MLGQVMSGYVWLGQHLSFMSGKSGKFRLGQVTSG